jgi:hypothetical protein
MAGRVRSYEAKMEEDVQPKTLHGVQECRMLVIQCADEKSHTEVLLGLEVAPGDIRIFPSGSWKEMGKPSVWLQEQLESALYDGKVRRQTIKAKKQDGPIKTGVILDGAV